MEVEAGQCTTHDQGEREYYGKLIIVLSEVQYFNTITS